MRAFTIACFTDVQRYVDAIYRRRCFEKGLSRSAFLSLRRGRVIDTYNRGAVTPGTRSVYSRCCVIRQVLNKFSMLLPFAKKRSLDGNRHPELRQLKRNHRYISASLARRKNNPRASHLLPLPHRFPSSSYVSLWRCTWKSIIKDREQRKERSLRGDVKYARDSLQS